MADTSQPKDTRQSLEFLVFGAILAVVIGIGLLLYSQRQTELRASPVGFDGLETWLRTNNVSVQNFFGGWQVDADRVDLAIVPLFDTNLSASRVRPQTEEEYLFQQDEYDQSLPVLLTKAQTVRTLIILPKWRTAMRLTGLGHPVLLSEAERIETLFQTLTGSTNAQLRYGDSAFTTYAYRSDDGTVLEAEIYAAQTISGSNCRPIIGTSDAMILGECRLSAGQGSTLVLSDPDLLNNHGLRLGDNAQIAASFLGGRASDGSIFIDYSQRSWFAKDQTSTARERDWSDLLRFFEPPFSTMWIGLALCLALALWRGSVRAGPTRRFGSNVRASKTLAIRARARLMRLSDQDGAMLGAYTSARIATTATALLGPANGANYASDRAFQTYVERRHPTHAARLVDVVSQMRSLPPRIPATSAAAYVENLEAVLEDITHDT